MQGILAFPVEPDTAVRSGSEPWLIWLGDAASEINYAGQRLQPGDIVVPYPRHHPDAAVAALYHG